MDSAGAPSEGCDAGQGKVYSDKEFKDLLVSEIHHLQTEKENFIVENKVLDIDDFFGNVSAIDFEGGEEQISKKYKDINLDFTYNQEIQTLSIDNSGIIEGALLEMLWFFS